MSNSKNVIFISLILLLNDKSNKCESLAIVPALFLSSGRTSKASSMMATVLTAMLAAVMSWPQRLLLASAAAARDVAAVVLLEVLPHVAEQTLLWVVALVE